MPEGVEVPQAEIRKVTVNRRDLLSGRLNAPQQNETTPQTDIRNVKESKLTQTRRAVLQEFAIALASIMSKRAVAKLGAGAGLSGYTSRRLDVASDVVENIVRTAKEKGDDLTEAVAKIDKKP